MRKYLLAGTGGRGTNMFGAPLLKDFADSSELVGLFDSNPLRCEGAKKLLGKDIPSYTDFDRALDELKPDCVVVATRDSTHAEYIVKAVKKGVRAISEKPLCTTAQQAKDILAAVKESGAECFVTHNMRYGAAMERMKSLVVEGEVGKVIAMEFRETLDRRHGADYFRRWHGKKENSGGLLVHKASHHFDILNWFASSRPVWLVARGSLNFYGKNGPFRSKRCKGCEHAEKCDFYADLFAGERARTLYLEAESADGYLRDGCVFDERIDIEDVASVIYAYENGIQVTYSLLAFAAYEGAEITIEGTGGRIEYKSVHSTDWAPGMVTVAGLQEFLGDKLLLFKPGGEARRVEIKRPEGGHGGADPRLREDFFRTWWDKGPTPQMASLEEGVQAVLVGCAANESMKTGEPLNPQELL